MPAPFVCPTLLDLSGAFDGFVVWLDDRELSKHPTFADASAAYRAALALAEQASADLNRIFERSV